MAKKVKITDQRKIRGIRRRWLINSVGVVLLVLVLALATFSAAIWSYLHHERPAAPGGIHRRRLCLLYPQPVLDQRPERGAAL